MMNCLITNASHDTLSYNDSGLMTWTVQFTPEHVSFNT